MATFITSVTVADLQKREPELDRLISNEKLKTFIDKAYSDFCLQFKLKYGYTPQNDSAEPLYNVLIEFLTLNYTFESLIKTNDIYLVKADRYKALYDEWHEKLNPNNTNDLYATCETIGILK
jgi:hypothetical protein